MTARAFVVRPAIAVGVLLAGAASTHPGQAYSLEGPSWANKRTNFYYIVSGQPTSAFTTALREALIDWNQRSAFKWVGVQKAANPCASSGPNGAALRPNACGQAFGSGVLGITMYNYNLSPERFIHAGTVFNSHVNFSIYDGPLRFSTTDFRRVALHEMGHALGLGHETNPRIPAIMQPLVSNTYRPTTDDINGIRALYGL